MEKLEKKMGVCHLEVVELLKQLIATKSFSKEEDCTANLLFQYLKAKNLYPQRLKNNVWVSSENFDVNKRTLLLNSHHDTVKPVAGWKKDPFEPIVENGKLFGLGSNDAGGALVALLGAFEILNKENLPFNLIYAATAEEEISGKDGIALLLSQLGEIDAGIVGEPTEMNMAIAEKGLVVIDGFAKGIAGHAARNEGVNAIYVALDDIRIIQDFEFEKQSDLLGSVMKSVTMISAGTQHNVIPDECQFTIDVRTNELYTNQEVVGILSGMVQSTLKPRSLRLNSSNIDQKHGLLQSAEKLGLCRYGSPTLSDQALMNFPTVKLGPGKSERSHTADEFIYLEEIAHGIEKYVALIKNLAL